MITRQKLETGNLSTGIHDVVHSPMTVANRIIKKVLTIAMLVERFKEIKKRISL